MRDLSLLAGAALLTAACGATEITPSGSSPTAPTPLVTQQPANVGGAWTGTSEFREGPERYVRTNINLMVSQSDHRVSGNWELVGRFRWQGTIGGTLTRIGETTEFNGRAQFVNVEHPTGTGVCQGEIELRGTVTAQTMRLDSPFETFYRFDNCPDYYFNFAWQFTR